MWITPTHAQNQSQHDRARGRRGWLTQSPQLHLLATRDFGRNPSPLVPHPEMYQPSSWMTTAQFVLSTSPLIAARKVSHTWLRHVKQLIPWNTPFKRAFWSLGLPIVMKRSVSSHVSLAQVPSLPAHQIINISRDGERDKARKRGRQRGSEMWRWRCG